MAIKTHIFEHSGVMLNVRYEPGDPPLFHSVRVMGSNYQPTGPDLQPLLHESFLIAPADSEGVAEAMTVLSAIVEELP